MSIRNKLYLGFGFLFFLILVVAIIGTRYIHALSADSGKILKDNYNTLLYTQAMYRTLDDFTEAAQDGGSTPALLDTFDVYLLKQEHNISEPGERELTAELRKDFDHLRLQIGTGTLTGNPNREMLTLRIRRNLQRINDINLDAIRRKNMTADRTATSAVLWLLVVSGACFLAALVFIFRFAGYIANPLKRLSRSIAEIARKNYAQRLTVNTRDELGEVAQNFNRMAEKLYEYEQSNLAGILLDKKRLEAVVNNISEGIMGFDPEGRVLFTNRLMAEILGLERQQVEGLKAEELCRRNDLFRSISARTREKNPATGDDDPLRVVVNNRELLFDAELHDAYWDDPGGAGRRRAGQVLVLRNVTPFVEKDLAKTNFIATVSHELKTPVSSIKLSLRLLEDDRVGNINAEQKELLANIHSDTERIARIISEILNMAQVESGNLQLNIQPCDPAEIIDYAVQAVKMPAEQKRVTIERKLPEHLPGIMADMEKTAWVLINLLVNAIRYSPEGGTITIGAEVEGEGNLKLLVTDHGQGIPPQYKDKIFDRYFKAPGRQSVTGTGLGLSIAREFMEAQQGSIGVVSEWQKGSTFFITVPRLA